MWDTRCSQWGLFVLVFDRYLEVELSASVWRMISSLWIQQLLEGCWFDEKRSLTNRWWSWTVTEVSKGQSDSSLLLLWTRQRNLLLLVLAPLRK